MVTVELAELPAESNTVIVSVLFVPAVRVPGVMEYVTVPAAESIEGVTVPNVAEKV